MISHRAILLAIMHRVRCGRAKAGLGATNLMQGLLWNRTRPATMPDRGLLQGKYYVTDLD
ncbi:hypothetical protein ABIA43_005328 [Bradyrhizobium sp. USDA 328]